MSRLIWAPKLHSSNAPEIADFAELECFKQPDRNVSIGDVSRVLQRQANQREDDEAHQSVIDAFADLQDRTKHCGTSPHAYPFKLNDTGSLVEIRAESVGTRGYILYAYLLLATRLNMQSERNAGGHDGTVLFEHFCASVAANFLGGPGAASSFVFGTGRETNGLADANPINEPKFGKAVNDLCKRLDEGFGFDKHPTSRITARDGKLDIVAWRGFSDGRDGRLIAFGQCKTGTHWKDDLAKLDPGKFCEKWVRKAFAVTPMKVYCVSDRVRENWYDHNKDGGIVFDRCRLMEFAEPLDDHLFDDISAWTRAAATTLGLKIDNA